VAQPTNLCIFVYIGQYTYVYINIAEPSSVSRPTNLCIYRVGVMAIGLYIHTRIHVYAYICKYVCICIYMYIYTLEHSLIHESSSVCVSPHEPMYVHVCGFVRGVSLGCLAIVINTNPSSVRVSPHGPMYIHVFIYISTCI